MSREQKMNINQLITREDMIDKVKTGKKRAVRRSNRFAEIGDQFEVDGQLFEMVNVYQQQLGDVTEEDAWKEGFESLDAYKESITSIHEDAVWVPKLKVWVHEFSAV